VSLKTGENHKGWVLRKVGPRRVILEKEQQIAVLELPSHDMSKGGSMPPAASAKEVVDEVAAKSSSPVNGPKPTGGSSPGSPVVAPTLIVQPPANPEPQVNPFVKAWLSTKS
jgi:hypothetical protein